MKPALDVLFHSYDYEKEQLQIMDTMSSDEYGDRIQNESNDGSAVEIRSFML